MVAVEKRLNFCRQDAFFRQQSAKPPVLQQDLLSSFLHLSGRHDALRFVIADSTFQVVDELFPASASPPLVLSYPSGWSDRRGLHNVDLAKLCTSLKRLHNIPFLA